MAKFQVGELIHHKRFDYRGVVVDVDASFSGTEEWYDTMARSSPPKDEPWYHVLVHSTDTTTYAAQDSLMIDTEGLPISHPLLETYFDAWENGRYLRNDRLWPS